MSKCRRVLRCYRCGAILQKNNPNEKGYISPESFERPTPIQILYCNNCFETMKAFNNSTLDTQISDDVVKILDDAVASDALILWVVDLFAFNGTLNPEIAKKIKSNRVVVVGNKVDLFGDRFNKNGLKDYLRERFESYGINPVDIVLLSNSPKTDYASLLNDLHEQRKGHDVYMLGQCNSGKTTIVNKFMKHYTNKTKRAIEAVTYPGTEAEVLEVPLSRSSFFYELPDLTASTNVYNIVEKDVQKQIANKKALKITTRSVLPGGSLLFGGLVEFAVVGKVPAHFHAYTGEGVEIKTISSKASESFFQDNLVKKSLRPVSDRFTSFLDFDIFEFAMEKDGKYHDIGIEGFGWVTFRAHGQKIQVHVPKGTAIKECLSKVR